MSGRRLFVLLVLGAAVLPAPARAGSGFQDLGRELRSRAQAAPGSGAAVDLGGYLRLRGALFDNLDLDRGLTPSGTPLYPIPLADPASQLLTEADARLRADLAVLAPGSAVAVKLRVDVLDGLALGSTPAAALTPAAATGQAPLTGLTIRRAWGEALTPLGLVAAGRMGSSWGLGILANGGDCETCDGGDAADRIAFVTALAGHLWAASYDFGAIGPTTERAGGTRVVDLDPSDDTRTVTFAVMRWASDLTRARRAAAGKLTFEYGAWLSHRWQDRDVPASYLPVGQPVPIDGAQVMARGYRATALDGWLRLTGPGLRVEAEAAALFASVAQPSLVPGVLLPGPVTSTQIGAALQSDVAVGSAFVLGVDAGYASGDPAPGFGAFPGGTYGRPGDLEGAQAQPPSDRTADNFRFHPDYRIDRILFREIVGAVTDALYVRPHARWRLVDLGKAVLEADLAAVASRAVEPTSTPGGAAPLGVELDPSLRYRTREGGSACSELVDEDLPGRLCGGGFEIALEHAVLFPLEGLDNPAAGMTARPAQLLRLRLLYVF